MEFPEKVLVEVTQDDIDAAYEAGKRPDFLMSQECVIANALHSAFPDVSFSVQASQVVLHPDMAQRVVYLLPAIAQIVTLERSKNYKKSVKPFTFEMVRRASL